MRVANQGISRTVVLAVVVIIVIIVVGGAAAVLSSHTTTVVSTVVSTSSVTTSISPTATSTIVPPTSTSSSSSVSSTSSSTTSSSSSIATSSSSSSVVQRPVIVDLKDSPDSLDPGIAVSGEGEEISGNSYLAPLYYNNSTSDFFGITAVNWTESANGCAWTFNWRNDIYYTNGDPFNAYVVWWNIYRAYYTEAGVSFFAGILFNGTGVSLGDVNSFNTPTNVPANSTLLSIMEQPNAAQVLGPYETRFDLTTPCYVANFLGLVAAGYMFDFVDPHFVEQNGGVILNTANPFMSTNGSNDGDGPYIVSQYIPDEYAVLIANPNYWAQNITNYNYFDRPARIPKIIENFKTDPLTRDLDLDSGRANIAVIQYQDVSQVLSSNSSVYIPNWGPGGTVEFLGLDTEKAPLNNLLVREAIVDAINVSAVEQASYDGYIIPVVGPGLHGFQGYNNSIQPPTYNPTLAAQLLAQAGYPNGTGLPPLSFDVVTGSYMLIGGQIIVSELASIGITANLQVDSEASLIAVEGSCCGNASTYPDIQLQSTTNYPDFSGYAYTVDQELGAYFFFNNQTVDNLLNVIASDQNITNRDLLISQATLEIQQNYAVIWLGQDTDLPQTGNGVGPVALDSCLQGDPGFFHNQYYWVYQGIPYTTLQWVC